MYLAFAVIAGLIGGAFSVYMRMELMDPGVQYMVNEDGSPDGHQWNMFVTAHGLIMVFFVVMPAVIGGFGNWIVPLMIGAPDMAFPRMNNIISMFHPQCNSRVFWQLCFLQLLNQTHKNLL